MNVKKPMKNARNDNNLKKLSKNQTVVLNTGMTHSEP